MKFARLTAPHLTGWVTAEEEPAVRACFEALAQVDGAGKAVADAGVPVMIWEGEGDPVHDRRKAFADANGIRFSRREEIISEWCLPMARRARREYGRLWMRWRRKRSPGAANDARGNGVSGCSRRLLSGSIVA